MEPRALFISVVITGIVGVGLFALILYVATQTTDFSPKNVGINTLEECKTLKYGGKNSLNIVFFAPRETSEKYADYLLSIAPFTDRKESFNFYYLDSYTPTCERYQNIALFCHSAALVKKAASCPNDLIVVVQEDESKIRSSAYSSVMSLNSKHAMSVFAHEFGHALAGLDEEYTPAYLSPSSRNCMSECTGFGEEAEGCFSGCSKDSAYRSINSGVMRTLSTDKYGTWNEQIMLEKLTDATHTALSGNAVDETSTCSQQFYYLITGTYTSNSITVVNKTLERGCAGGNGIGEVNLTQFDQSGDVLSQETFNPRLIYTDAPPVDTSETIDGEVYINEGGTFTISVPATTTAPLLRIEQPASPLTDIFLSDIGGRACII